MFSSPATDDRRRSSRRSSSQIPPSSSPLRRIDESNEFSDLAAPLPPSSPHGDRSVFHGRSGGPGSVLVSEIDLSSPLNYGTPSSISSSLRTPRSVGVRGTPIRIRADIQSDKRLRQVNVSEETGGEAMEPSEALPPSDAGTSDLGAEAQMVIWGTDVSVNVAKNKFKKFIKTFLDSHVAEDEVFDSYDPNEPLYIQKLQEINTLEEPFLNVNSAHVQQFDEDLYRQLVCYPQEVIPTLDMAVNEMFFEKYPDTVLSHQILVRPFNADKTRNMRGLNPEDIDQLITIYGMVIRLSNLVPEMSEALFRCSVCHFTASVEVERGRIVEPTLCTSCQTNHSFTLIHNRSSFTDKQMVKLQEAPEDMPAGQTPHTVILYAHVDLVDKVQPGDRIAVTGIYRAVPLRLHPKQRNVKSVYKTHIDVVHYRKLDVKRLHSKAQDDEGNIVLSSERRSLMEELSQKPDIYERLARAIAPSIYENEDVKKGILLQLFGGSVKDFSNSGRGNFRPDINILLCGDPGTSKSQLLQYVFKLVPRSQYTSGKGSSAVGLTAYVTKDPETRQLVLQTGALVLADNGICCIDEFDKMNDSTRSILHEVMEQQTLSIAKAGIICQLNARTSILAAANPMESKWNPKRTIVENIMLPHTLMSRFDLIFLMLDPQDEIYDRKLARHLVSLYYKSTGAAEEEEMDTSILRDYIAHAKDKCNPELSDEAGTHLIQSYVKMRQIGSGRGQITAYPRQLESLIRLSEAHAKMRLSPIVELIDVEEANRLHREALKQSATDPMSGKIDVSILTTGQSEGYRKRRAQVKTSLKDLIGKKGKVQTLNYLKTWNDLKEYSDVMITRDMFEDALKDLLDDGYISLTGRTTIRVNQF